MPPAIPIIAAVAGAAATAAFHTAWIGAIVGAVVAGVVGVGLTALTGGFKKPVVASIDTKAREIKANITSNVAPIPVIYGKARVGGSVIYLATKNRDAGNFLYMDVCIAEGEISGVTKTYIDGVDSESSKFGGTIEKIIITLDWDAFSFPASALKTRYQAYYKLSSASTWKKIDFGSDDNYGLNLGTQTNGDFSIKAAGQYDFKVEASYYTNYRKLTTEEVATATATIASDNSDFSLDASDSMTVSQAAQYSEDFLRIQHRNGTPGQSTPSMMLDAPQWTEDHKLSGLAHTALAMKADIDKFPRIPTVTFDVEGKVVWDLRDDSTAYTTNPILCTLDYLMNDIYGVGLDISEIDTDSFTDEANYSDVSVTIDGDSVARYRMNGVVDTKQKVIDNLNDMLTSCRGMVIFTGGKFKIVIDKPGTPTFTLNKDNLIGEWSILRSGSRVKCNKVEARFINRSKQYEPDLFTTSSAVFLEEDNGDEAILSIELPFTTDRPSVKQLAYQALKQTRQDKTIQVRATMAALQLECGDLTYLTHPKPGWTEKIFRCVKVVLEPVGTVQLTLSEYDADVYDIESLLDPDDSQESTLENPFDMVAPGVPSVLQRFYDDANGINKIKLIVSWADSESSFIDSYIVEYKLSSSDTWIVLPPVRNSENTVTITDVVPETYDFRVKAVNYIGNASDYTELLEFETLPPTYTPDNLTDLKADINNGNIKLKWTKHADNVVLSGGTIRIRHSNNTTGASWADAANFTEEIDGFKTEITMPLLEGTYLLKPVNYAGVESEDPVTYIYDLPEPEVKTLIFDADQATAGFPGTHNSTVVIDDTLALDGLSPLFDSASGNFDSAAGNFDDLNGYETEGSYLFKNGGVSYWDFGAIFNVNLVQFYHAIFSDLSANFDGRAGMFDEQTGMFDGEQPTNINVRFFYSCTQTNPSIGAVWSEYREFVNTEAKGRGFKFKVEILTENTQQNIYIDALTVKMYLLNRPTAQNSLSITNAVGGLDVTHTKAFYATPVTQIGIVNMQSGDYPVLASETRTGFNVIIKDSTDTPVTRIINYQSHGYGEETTADAVAASNNWEDITENWEDITENWENIN